MGFEQEVAVEESPLIVRGATAGDLPLVEALIEPFVAEGRLLPRTTEELHVLLPSGFVAWCDGRLVGFAALEVYSPKLAELRSLAVLDAYRGRGIGRRLVEACLRLAADRRVFEVMVVTSEDRFFQGCGFDFTLPGEKKALFFPVREKH
ncbi:MAG: GNAT family N-acetyltransferase [Planctomycetaceae bacterium]